MNRFNETTLSDDIYRNFVVAGTGFQNADGSWRRRVIQRFCAEGTAVTLRPESDNPHDPNAVSVWMLAPRFAGLLGKRPKQIGFIKAANSAFVRQLIEDGRLISACVDSYHAPYGLDHPRVSLQLHYKKAHKQ